MSTEHSSTRAIVIGVGLLIAAGGGYFAARMTAPEVPLPPAAAPAPAQTEPDEVVVDPSYLAVVGIVTETVAAGGLATEIIAPATVHAEIQGEAVMTAHVSGTVTGITKRLGDRVRVGEVLATVESREAAAMTAQRDVAASKVALARSALARETSLFESRVTPRQDLERAQSELEAAEVELRRAQAAMDAEHVTSNGNAVSVISPLSGTVTSRTAALGLFVRPETELFRVADPRFIDIDASVTAMDAQRVAIGDQASVLTRSGARVRAVVRSVTPILNEETRSATVVLDPLPNEMPLTPGDVVQVVITPKGAGDADVVVPEEAVQNIGGRDVVFVKSANGFRVQPVVIGARSAGRVSVLSGLNAGETIATTNAFFLKAELAKGAGEDE